MRSRKKRQSSTLRYPGTMLLVCNTALADGWSRKMTRDSMDRPQEELNFCAVDEISQDLAAATFGVHAGEVDMIED